MTERLVGMQAQEPEDPDDGLWSRLEGFDPAKLTDLIATRAAVREQFMRAIIRLLTAQDGLAIHPLRSPVLAPALRSPYGAAVLTVGRFTPAPGEPPDAVEAITAEGMRLLDLLRPGAPGRVRFVPEP